MTPAPKFGMLIPNRVFVGGIASNVRAFHFRFTLWIAALFLDKLWLLKATDKIYVINWPV